MNDSPGSEGVQWGLPGRQYFKFTVGAGRGSQQAELPQAGCRSGSHCAARVPKPPSSAGNLPVPGSTAGYQRAPGPGPSLRLRLARASAAALPGHGPPRPAAPAAGA